MGYEITNSPQAQIEIDEAVEYYSRHSDEAHLKFIAKIKDAYKTLEINPFFRIRY